MLKYLKSVKISLQNTFVYNQNYVISMITNIIFIVVVIFLWQSVYSSNVNIKGYSFQAMVLYIFVVNTLFEMINTSEIMYKIATDIRLGNLSRYLIRPFSHFLAQLADICGAKISRLPAILILNALIGVFFLTYYELYGNVAISISAISVSLFCLFMLLSFFWNFVLDYMLGLLGFWMDNPWVLYYIKGRIVVLLCGLLIPLDLFPAFIKNILDYLPFQYYVFYPYRVLIGTATIHDGLLNLSAFAIWILIISIATFIIWNKSVARYTAVGG